MVHANNVAFWLSKRLQFLKDNDSCVWSSYIRDKSIFVGCSIDFG